MDKSYSGRILWVVSAVAGLLGIGAAAYFGSSTVTLPNVDNPQVQKLTEAQQVLETNLREANEQLDRELKEIEVQYTLPPDGTFVSEHSFPDINNQLEQVKAQSTQRSAMDADFEVEQVWYEPGYFKSDALAQWQCAWLKEAVLAKESNDAKRLNQALTQLNSLKEKPEIQMFPDYAVFLNDNVAPIIRGDTRPARDFINSGYTCVKQNQIK